VGIHGISSDVLIDEISQRIVMQLKMFIAKGSTEVSSGVERVKYPETWWQAFKLANFNNKMMRWFLRWRPVKYTTVSIPQSITVTKVCPHLPVTDEAARNGRMHFEFLDPQSSYSF
jgi:hypothetical protein